MDIKKIKERIEGLANREKIIVTLTLAAASVFIFHILLYSPAQLMLRLKKQALHDLGREIEATVAALSYQSGQKPPAEKIELPETEDLSGMLAAISREANMARVDFISIVPEGFEYKGKFIEMKVKIELRVKFRELYDFIKNVEARHKLFLVQDVKFETNSAIYPSGIALLRAVTYLRKKE